MDDDTSIATSDVLSEHDQELLNSSEKETGNEGKQAEAGRIGQTRDTTSIKSNTMNSKNTNLRDQLHQGMLLFINQYSNSKRENEVRPETYEYSQI